MDEKSEEIRKGKINGEVYVKSTARSSTEPSITKHELVTGTIHTHTHRFKLFGKLRRRKIETKTNNNKNMMIFIFCLGLIFLLFKLKRESCLIFRRRAIHLRETEMQRCRDPETHTSKAHPHPSVNTTDERVQVKINIWQNYHQKRIIPNVVVKFKLMIRRCKSRPMTVQQTLLLGLTAKCSRVWQRVGCKFG